MNEFTELNEKSVSMLKYGYRLGKFGLHVVVGKEKETREWLVVQLASFVRYGFDSIGNRYIKKERHNNLQILEFKCFRKDTEEDCEVRLDTEGQGAGIWKP